MGVSNTALIASWYLTYGWILLIMTVALSGVLKVLLLKHCSFILLVAFFWLFSMSYVAYGYLVQTFFDKAMTGGIVGMIGSFAMFIAKIAVVTTDSPYSEQVALSLMAPCAFATGIGIIADYEKNEQQLDLGSWSIEVDNFDFQTVIIMLTLDIGLYTLLGWYFEAVLPKEYGVRLPAWFCFLSSYWKGDAVDDALPCSKLPPLPLDATPAVKTVVEHVSS